MTDVQLSDDGAWRWDAEANAWVPNLDENLEHDPLSRYITALIHAESKVGKTWLGDSGPVPRLILDAEAGGIRFTPSKKIWWDPLIQAMPVNDGTWETCIVRCRSLATLSSVFNILNAGQHPFRSVTLDSVMEIQEYAKADISASKQMDQQQWGTLATTIEDLVRKYRDLTEHPTQPLNAVIYICGTRLRDGLMRPLLDGKIVIKLPYLVDCCGYLYTQRDEAGTLRRALCIEPGGIAVAGNRFGGRLPGLVWDPNINTMLDTLYGAEAA